MSSANWDKNITASLLVALVVTTSTTIYFAVENASLKRLNKPACTKASCEDRANKYAILRSKKAAKRGGHGRARSQWAAEEDLSSKDQEIVEAFVANQKSATRLSYTEQAKKLFDGGNGFGVLSTNSKLDKGFPVGSIVGFAIDPEDGKPFFTFSKLSTHRHDLDMDKNASLTITQDNFCDANDARCSITGTIVELKDKETTECVKSRLRDTYLTRHPGATWVDFTDFSWYKFDEVLGGKFVGGFAAASHIKGDDFLSCASDPHVSYATKVIQHMNEDHADSLIDIVWHQCGGLPIINATMVDVDYLGMTIKGEVTLGNKGGYTKIRVPWQQPVTDRKTLKDTIISMARAASLVMKDKK